MDLDTRARRAAQGIHRAVEVREMSLKLEEPKKVERFDRYQNRKQRNRRIGAIVVAVACVIALGAVAVSTGMFDRSEPRPASPPDGATGNATLPAGSTAIGTLTLTDDGCAIDVMPAAVPAGNVTLTVVNETDAPLGFDVPRFVPDVITYEELVASVEESRAAGEAGEAVDNVAPEGVAAGLLTENVGPNRTRTFTGNLFAGDYAYVCFKNFPGVGLRPYAVDGPFTITE